MELLSVIEYLVSPMLLFPIVICLDEILVTICYSTALRYLGHLVKHFGSRQILCGLVKYITWLQYSNKYNIFFNS